MLPQSRATIVAATAASVVGVVGTLYYLNIQSFFQRRLKHPKVEPRVYSPTCNQSLKAFRAITQQSARRETYPIASTIQKNVPIYDCPTFRLSDAAWTARLQDELFHIIFHGPGVFVLKQFCGDVGTIDAANAAFARIIAREQEENCAKGDHFAPSSANSRIWNSFSKHCLEDPKSFARYYSNPLFKLVCEAYLGPAYRITSQVNIVKPGGKAQVCHRDYHLGFQTEQDVAKWPKPTHVASQLLTLQGAVAHSDMPLASGPTRLLPFSQMFDEGYMAYRLPKFNDYLIQNYVCLPLEKGDAIFFNPALFHAAGENQTDDFERSANLIQVSSAFGKPMESIDGLPLVQRCWDLLLAKFKAESMSDAVDALIRAIGEGYPFPTNLDNRPPAPGGMAPESEQDLLRKGLEEDWSCATMMAQLVQMRSASVA